MRSEFASFTPLPDGTGYVVSVARGRRPDGSRNRMKRTVRGTEAKAKREARKMYELLGDPQASKSKDITLKVFIEREWLPYEKSNPKVRDETYRQYEQKARLYIIPALGNVKVGRVSAEHIEKLMAKLSITPTIRQPKDETRYLGDRSIQSVYRVFHILMKAAVRWLYAPYSPFDGLDAPSVKKGTPKSLTASQSAEYFAAFRGHVLEPAILLSLGAGIRRSESLGCDWERIDFDAGAYTLTRGLHQRGKRIWYEPLKTQESKATTPLTPFALFRLRELSGDDPSGPMVQDGAGAMAPEKAVRLYEKRIAEAGLTPIPWRNLRHSFANILKGERLDVLTISMLLRHTNTATVQAHYFNRDIAPLKAALDTLPEWGNSGASTPDGASMGQRSGTKYHAESGNDIEETVGDVPISD